MTKTPIRTSSRPFRLEATALSLTLLLHFATVRRGNAEDRIDFKYMFYQEDNDRIRVLTPAVVLEKELSPTLTLKIEGVYNAISGASPPIARAMT